MLTNEETATWIYKMHKYIFEEQSILTIVLKGHLIMENHLENLLDTILVDPSVLNYEKMYLMQKINLLAAMGVFTKKDIKAYQRFNKIRNNFAHDIDYEITSSDLDAIINSFTPKLVLIREEMTSYGSESVSKLQSIIFSLIVLLILQNSEDKESGKKPHHLIEVSDIERLIQYGKDAQR
ncbi:hypothetical protein [Jeotgalibacillus terrae]|uniref:DUF4145 domain-containing protein n=1 Tax=Jeotgalibacillus terrae TaxID=587735 RepID=A0ABW5ZLC9_9BACL|nr:hypothetical protein [Jeotgalibacillus terrae]MBM7577655.1 hypothetical protein [Jeotgalibacillus terrae]